MRNFIFISPAFPKTYYQFPKAWKDLGGCSLCIGDTPYDFLSPQTRESMDEYYEVSSLNNYDELYRAVAWFAHKHGKPEWLESHNEFWLESDAKLRNDFNITSGICDESVKRFRHKSLMKQYYKQANCKTARYHMVSTIDQALNFIQKVNYPVIVKPDDGVGANATWAIHNDEELNQFYNIHVKTPYIMEEFIPGHIESFDGITDQNGQIIFKTSHMFPKPIMDIVNHKSECFYYSQRLIPEDLDTIGTKVIEAFDVKARFFHCEYIRLEKNVAGLGKKGDLIGLEVNMRPIGGYSLDMMNYANDIDVYRIYANMCMYNEGNYQTDRPYHAVYCGRRIHEHYAHSIADIYRKYGQAICMQERMPHVLGTAMGDDAFMARFKTFKEVQDFKDYIFEKQVDEPQNTTKTIKKKVSVDEDRVL